MASLWTPVLVLLPILGLAACSRPASDADIYRTAVGDLATHLAPRPFCVSTTRWYGAELLPANARDALTEDGFQFIDPSETPDTSVLVLTLSSIREDASDFRLTADVGQIVRVDGAYWWEGADYDYTIRCSWRDCLVAERSGPGSSHAGVGVERVTALESGAAIGCPR